MTVPTGSDPTTTGTTGTTATTRTTAVDAEVPPLMPAAFFGHGNPMNALSENRYTAAWRAFGESVPRPRAPDHGRSPASP